MDVPTLDDLSNYGPEFKDIITRLVDCVFRGDEKGAYDLFLDLLSAVLKTGLTGWWAVVTAVSKIHLVVLPAKGC